LEKATGGGGSLADDSTRQLTWGVNTNDPAKRRQRKDDRSDDTA
jgi:hypothetical protein